MRPAGCGDRRGGRHFFKGKLLVERERIIMVTQRVFANLACRFLALLIVVTFSSRAALGQEQSSVAAEVSPTPTTQEPLAAGSRAALALPEEKRGAAPVHRFDKPPTIDGVLDDEVWKSAAVLKDFYQVRPGDNIAPSEPTEVLLGYDAKFLYVAFRARSAGRRVRATVAKRDAVQEEDHVRLYLDTFDDRRRAYIFIFNPLGVQQDGIYTEGVGEDYTIDVVMESKGVVTEQGYTVEAAIPFKSLRYKSGAKQPWGVHVQRRIKNVNNELTSWMPIARGQSGFLNQEGHIAGLEGILAQRTLEIIPSLTVSETGSRTRTIPRSVVNSTDGLIDPGRFVSRPIEFDPGLTAKVGITPTVTLDLALNPDFAQVEADQLVVTANQRFPIFYPEKRPFFLEGKEIFSTPLNAVNTRAIVDPDLAVKLSGKHGRNSFGILLASDNAPGNFSEEERTDPGIRPGIEKFLDKNAYIGVLRLKRDIGKESNLGLLFTSYNFIERHNQLGGIDGRFRLGPQTVLTFQALGTTSRRFFFDPDAGRNIYRTGNGFGYSYSLEKTARNLTYGFTGEGRTRDYRADVGFTRRVNTNSNEAFFRYESDPNPKARLISYGFAGSGQVQYDWQGRTQGLNGGGRAFVNLTRQTAINGGVSRIYERLFEEEFGVKRAPGREGEFAGADPERSTSGNSYFIEAATTPSEKFSFYFYANYIQGAFDLDFGAGPRFPRVSPVALDDPGALLDPGPGDERYIEASVVYQPSKAFRTSLNITKDRLVRRDTKRVAFDDTIYSWRASYQFTRFTFARARIDYTTLGSNIRSQYLLGWAPNPGTALYVGYNDDMNRNGFSPFTDQYEPGFRRNGRTFFIKMSYLFRRGL